MTITYFNDMNVYFHMKNHYRKLKNVKSTIDNRISQVYLKPASASHSERCLTVFEDERHSKNCPHLPNHSSSIKRHSCFSSDARSDTSLCSNSRPSTRRNPREVPNQTSTSRSSSLGPNLRKFTISNRKSSKNKNQIKKTASDNDKDEKNDSGNINRREYLIEGSQQNDVLEKSHENSHKSSRSVSSESKEHNGRKRHNADEHEYLQFLLRITEDIIMNDYFTKKDISKVLENHIEANRQRLEMNKMKAHVSRLCRELNIEYENTDDIYNDNSSDIFCYSPKPNINLTNCECANMRNLNFGKTITFESKNTENNSPQKYSEDTFLKLNYSLGRVTECTEPTESLNTVDENNMPSNITITSYDVDLVLPGLEIEKEEDLVVEKQDECVSEKEILNWEKLDNSSPKIVTPKVPKLCLVTPKTSSTNIIKDQFVDGEKSILTTCQDTYSDDFESNRTEVMSAKNPTVESPKNTSRSEKFNETSIESVKNNIPSVVLPNVLEQLNNTAEKSGENSPKTYSIHNSTESILKDLSPLNSRNNSPNHTKNAPRKNRETLKSPKSEKSCSDSQKNSTIKLILDGNIKNDDYILVNGPVYIFKALIDTNPKLVRIQHDIIEKVEKETNVTPTLEEKIENSPRLSPSSEITLHSLKQKLEERFIFNNFRQNSRLISEDYDLTPEREKDINKYHYLMVDAATSISNVDLSKNNADVVSDLLLSDSYVLDKDRQCRRTNFEDVSYVKMYREIPEHDYIKQNGYSRKILEENYQISVSEPSASINDGIESVANSELSDKMEIMRGVKRTRNVSPESPLRSEGEASNKN